MGGQLWRPTWRRSDGWSRYLRRADSLLDYSCFSDRDRWQPNPHRCCEYHRQLCHHNFCAGELLGIRRLRLLGDGSTSDSPFPVQVVGVGGNGYLTDVESLAAGAAVAILASGEAEYLGRWSARQWVFPVQRCACTSDPVIRRSRYRPVEPPCPPRLLPLRALPSRFGWRRPGPLGALPRGGFGPSPRAPLLSPVMSQDIGNTLNL